MEDQLSQLKVRCFDLEEARRVDRAEFEKVIQFVIQRVGLEDVETVQDFVAAIDKLYPESEDEDEEYETERLGNGNDPSA